LLLTALAGLFELLQVLLVLEREKVAASWCVQLQKEQKADQIKNIIPCFLCCLPRHTDNAGKWNNAFRWWEVKTEQHDGFKRKQLPPAAVFAQTRLSTPFSRTTNLPQATSAFSKTSSSTNSTAQHQQHNSVPRSQPPPNSHRNVLQPPRMMPHTS
jgi:hypothetical protein